MAAFRETGSLVLLVAGLGAGQAAAQHVHADSAKTPEADSAFHALQTRGKLFMGVDQYTSAHQFESLPDGGRIELQRKVEDAAGVAQIRRHLQEIAAAFQAGDFGAPGAVHDGAVPGTAIMRSRRGRIRYQFRELPRGGEVRIMTSDPDAIAAIHEFLAFQRHDHQVQ